MAFRPHYLQFASLPNPSFFKEFKVEIELLKVRFANGSTRRSFHVATVVTEVLMRRWTLHVIDDFLSNATS
jgi:hypothetical protein